MSIIYFSHFYKKSKHHPSELFLYFFRIIKVAMSKITFQLAEVPKTLEKNKSTKHYFKITFCQASFY